jgi:hypothetical protein
MSRSAAPVVIKQDDQKKNKTGRKMYDDQKKGKRNYTRHSTCCALSLCMSNDTADPPSTTLVALKDIYIHRTPEISVVNVRIKEEIHAELYTDAEGICWSVLDANLCCGVLLLLLELLLRD